MTSKYYPVSFGLHAINHWGDIRSFIQVTCENLTNINYRLVHTGVLRRVHAQTMEQLAIKESTHL